MNWNLILKAVGSFKDFKMDFSGLKCLCSIQADMFVWELTVLEFGREFLAGVTAILKPCIWMDLEKDGGKVGDRTKGAMTLLKE